MGPALVGATDIHGTWATGASASSYNIVEHTTAGDWVVVSVVGGTPERDEKIATWGLIDKHAYGVIGIYTDEATKLDVVLLQNPHDPNGPPLLVPAVVFDSIGNNVSWGTPPDASPNTSYGPGETPGDTSSAGTYVAGPGDEYGPGDRPGGADTGAPTDSGDTSYTYTYGDDGGQAGNTDTGQAGNTGTGTGPGYI
ncbi:MAG: hypothetical protein U0235_32580 [Polyangiaceae bacterium]